MYLIYKRVDRQTNIERISIKSIARATDVESQIYSFTIDLFIYFTSFFLIYLIFE